MYYNVGNMCAQITEDKLASYKAYLTIVQERMIDKYFEEQKPYICCKAGCSHCCEKGQYPVTEIELAYLMLGYKLLPFETQLKIRDNFDKLKSQYEFFKQQHSGTKDNPVFMYKCPFLVAGRCSVYEYRAVICRTHGLLFFVEEKDGTHKNKIPYCVHYGLNYSNIYDEETETLSDVKMAELGIKQEPLAYNLGLKALFRKELTDNFDFEFGEVKALVDWFVPE